MTVTTNGSATAMVRDYLGAMEARDLARAGAMLTPGFTMVFPGGASFTRLEEVIAWAKPRYRWVKKRFDRFDETPAANGETVVYCLGTLYGEWPDGRAFEGIRFIDRFTLRGGKLADQQVWNDIAEIQAQETARGA